MNRRLSLLLSSLLLVACSGGRDRTVVSAACGNGYVESGESCDDGNRNPNDGCDAACRVEPAVCGDGILQAGEGCEDRNTVAGDGCDGSCVSEVPTACGNGIWQAGEQCDDGNLEDGDGCSATCIDELRAACGDGKLQQGEECDDGNVGDGDGCSASCRSERAAACGDRILQQGEQCDDGNVNPGDGCSATCTNELRCDYGCPTGFSCDLATGTCAGGAPTDITVDVRVFTIRGAIIHNGSAPTSEFQEQDCGTIRFEDAERGLVFTANLDCQARGQPFTYSVDVYAGTYDVEISGQSFTSIPTNRYRAVTGLPVTQNMDELVFDVVTHHVEGYVTHNGAAPTAEFQEEDCGTIRFESPVQGYAISANLDCSVSGPFRYAIDLYPGDYDIFASGQSWTSLPTTRFHGRSNLPVRGAMRDLVIDVLTVPADGFVLHRGIPPTTQFPEVDCGTVRFEELLEGYVFNVPLDCSTGSFDFDAVVFPGTYRISARGQSFTSLPTVDFVGFASQPIRGATTGLVIDVLTHRASGSVLHNSGAPQTQFRETDCGTVRFEEVDQGTSFTTNLDCSTGQFVYDTLVYPGTYRISASGQSFTSIPTVRYEGFRAQAIRGDVTGLVIDVRTLQVDGIVRKNGVVPTTQFPEADCGTVRFSDAERGYAFSTNVDCQTGQFTFRQDVYLGRYEVSVSGQSFTSLPTTRWIQFTDLPVEGALGGIVLDVPTRTTTGFVIRDGVAPTTQFAEQDCGTARYEEIDLGYVFSTPLDCTRPNAPFSWAQDIFPGTYQISVSGQSFTNLPTTRYRAYSPIRID